MPILTFVTVQDMARPAPTRVRETQAELYDFRRPMTLAREHGRAIEMAAETFARQWGTQLTSRMRALCTVTLESVDMLPYDEYAATLPDPTLLVEGAIAHSRAACLLQIPLETTLLWIDYLLGGPGLDGAVPPREHTEIETALLTEMLQANLRDARYAFAAVTPLDVTIKGFQYSPPFAQLVAASDPVIAVTYTLRCGEREDRATFMVPADVMLESLRAGERDDPLANGPDAEALEARERVRATMQTVPVEVGVRLNPLTISPRDVLGLAPGDVVRLNHPVTRPFDVVVDGNILAHAVAGSNGRQLACQVVDFEEDER